MFVRAAGLPTFRLGPIQVCLDLVDTNAEWGVDLDQGTCMWELYLVESSDRTEGPKVFSQLSLEFATAVNANYGFGGDSIFVVQYAEARRAGRTSLPVERFLWPLTYWKSADDIFSESLSVDAVLKLERGVLIRVFADLATGAEASYQAAAAALDLSTVWSVV